MNGSQAAVCIIHNYIQVKYILLWKLGERKWRYKPSNNLGI